MPDETTPHERLTVGQLHTLATLYDSANRRDNRDRDGRASAAVGDFLYFVEQKLAADVDDARAGEGGRAEE